MKSNYRIIVAGGGTGGHFFPALALYSSLQNKGINVKYMGSKFGIESNYFSNNGSESILLNIQGIQRQFTLDGLKKNSLFPFKFLHSYLLSRKIMYKYKPHVVIGTGGYSSGLPLLAAIHVGIKTIIQEQNSFPGITTRHLSSRVDKICIAYEDAAHYFKKKILFLQATLYGRTFS